MQAPHIRFWNKVNFDGPISAHAPQLGKCWLWRGAIFSKDGYGRFNIKRLDGTWTSVPAHRWSYTEVRGEIENALTVDHLCRTRLCVRPDHLEAVTSKTNILRGEAPSAQNARKTHCKNGHPFDLFNTLIYAKPEFTYRCCRECGKQATRRYRERRHANTA